MRFLAMSLVVLLSLPVSSTDAAVMYSYQGAFMSSIIDDSVPSGSYESSMSVQGSMILSQSLGMNDPATDRTSFVSEFSFTDGRSVLTNLNASGIFQFATDASGTINQWYISLQAGTLVHQGDEVLSIVTRDLYGLAGDGGSIIVCLADDGAACVDSGKDAAFISTSGRWHAAHVSEPTSLALVGLGIVGLMTKRRCRSTRGVEQG